MSPGRSFVGLLAAMLASGCTSLVWYGRSDDRRHIAAVLEKNGRQHVRFDLVDGPDFRGVGVEALVLGPGRHLTYPAQLDDGWAVVHDGVTGERFDAVGELLVAGEHVAYSAQRAGRWHVVHDGIAGEAVDNILPGSMTLSGTGRWALAAQAGGLTFVVIDGKRTAAVEGTGQLKFSADGQRVGYVIRETGKNYVVVEGEKYGPYEAVADLHPGAPAVFLARVAQRWHAFVDGQPGPAFDRVAGLSMSNGTALYSGRRGAEEWVIDGRDELGPFRALKSTLLRDGTGVAVFVARQAAGWFVCRGNKMDGPWDEVEAPIVAGTHVGFIGERAGRRVVVVDGEPVSTWAWAGSLALSSEGPRVAHLARRAEGMVVVVDGVERKFDLVVADTLAFSRDGRRFACVTGDRAKRRLFITSDKGNTVDVDMEEFAANLSRSSTAALLMPPEVSLLRRWVEAQLEL